MLNRLQHKGRRCTKKILVEDFDTALWFKLLQLLALEPFIQSFLGGDDVK